eukprot:528975-Hanusia_phi.AAC.1
MLSTNGRLFHVDFEYILGKKILLPCPVHHLSILALLLFTTASPPFSVLISCAGNDPKPFAPPMKLSEQMVVAMGGRGSRDYLEFHKHCCKAYLILRKSAKLFVALFDLVRAGEGGGEGGRWGSRRKQEERGSGGDSRGGCRD